MVPCTRALESRGSRVTRAVQTGKCMPPLPFPRPGQPLLAGARSPGPALAAQGCRCGPGSRELEACSSPALHCEPSMSRTRLALRNLLAHSAAKHPRTSPSCHHSLPAACKEGSTLLSHHLDLCDWETCLGHTFFPCENLRTGLVPPGRGSWAVGLLPLEPTALLGKGIVQMCSAGHPLPTVGGSLTGTTMHDK